MKQLISLLSTTLVMMLFLGGVACADPHDKLIPLLVGIEGWEAQPANGSSMLSAQMKMISARRSYSKGEKGIAVSLMVNSGPVQDCDLQESSREDNINRVRSRLVKGFWVKNTYNKSNNSGQLIVHLAYNKEANALLLANYSKMDEDEILADLKKLNWDAMKVVVAPML
ncbi:MAG: hypothetical protein HGA96_16105 [Desulfobulbaceae bacterium]|nr:hypothetical protein [Desulfobulbaceae bacterium]